MLKIKISGIKRYEDVTLVNGICPDYVGFVFYEGEHRITANIASHLVFDLRPEIDTIGMFKNQSASEITSLLSAGIIDMVELCGDESEEFIENLKLRAEAKIIKRFSLKTPADLLRINESRCDYISLTVTDYMENSDISKNVTKPVFLRGRGEAVSFADSVKKAEVFAVDSAHMLDSGGFISPASALKMCARIRSNI